MAEKKVQVKRDLQARTAALFVQLAGKFEANTKMVLGHNRVNCKSLMGMIALEVSKGHEVILTAEGPDSEEAVKELALFIETSDEN